MGVENTEFRGVGRLLGAVLLLPAVDVAGRGAPDLSETVHRGDSRRSQRHSLGRDRRFGHR